MLVGLLNHFSDWFSSDVADLTFAKSEGRK